MQCPYCGSKMKGKAALPFIPPRRMRIYDAVIAAGKAGISSANLLLVFYGDKKPPPGGAIVLRVNIHELNKIIAPIGHCIVGRQGYRLVSVKDE